MWYKTLEDGLYKVFFIQKLGNVYAVPVIIDMQANQNFLIHAK